MSNSGAYSFNSLEQEFANSSFSNSISSANEDIITAASSNLNLTSNSQLSSDSFNQDLERIAQSLSNQASQESLSNLALSNVSNLDYAGNTLATARAITVGSTSQTFSDWVGSTDTNDYYRFSLSNTSNFNLALNGLSSDADVTLLNSNGNTITGSYNGGSVSESIFRQLAAGTYYIRVYPYSGNTSYNLGVSATAASSTYSSTSGYGLVNAAAAVAKALGQSTFADVPNLGGNNWGADLIKAPEVWAKGYTGQGITVAVLDTGVDRNHSDLSSNIWTNSREIAGNGIDDDGNGYKDDVYGWNFISSNNNTLDVYGHGTHVSGTIAGVNNNFGVTGIAYNAKIMPVKVLSDSGSGSWTSVANGIRYAADNGAKVINMSLGGSSGDSNLQSAIQYASSKGAIVVMAAGNSALSQPGYPGSYATDWGLVVGAVDSNKSMASFSNRAGSNSSMVYVTAPGVGVYSTLPNNSYASWNGTSMATPHVAGVVALMLSAKGNLTDGQIRQIMKDTSSNSSATGGSSNSIGSSSTLAATTSNSLLSYNNNIEASFFTGVNNLISDENALAQVNLTEILDSLTNQEKQEDVDVASIPQTTDLDNDQSNLIGVDLEAYLTAMQSLNQITVG